MKVSLTLIALACSLPAMAANFGANTASDKPSSEPPKTNSPALPPVADTGVQFTSPLRVFKKDGSTLIAQGALGSNVLAVPVITVSGSDALAAGNGRCAFNVRYEEGSAQPKNGTTNRFYSNDALIAQNTAISLEANKPKSLMTQPYLFSGLNNVKVVLNADSTSPLVAWIRINVTGACGGVTAPAPKETTTTPPKVEVTPPKPVVVVPPKPIVFTPGSSEWNNLFTAFGYSNFATTQLKTKGYARYADIAKLNADLTAVVNAKQVTQDTYNSLMSRWNSFTAEKAFRDLMAAVVVSAPGVK